MKLTTLLLFVNLLQVSAIGYSQTGRFNLRLNKMTIKEALSTIESQSSYKFVYRDSDIENKVVSSNIVNSPIEEVMKIMLNNTGAKYRILDNNLIVIAPDELLQQKKVSGTIIDSESGETLIGVSVFIMGTNQGTVTDSKGNFSLNVSDPNAVLRITYMGYLPQEISVKGQIRFDIKLSRDIKNLEEVVVIGYGTQKKANVTSSVSTLKDKKLDERPIARVDQALVGQLAGINVKQTTGVPGKAFSIQVRGTGSISAGNEPLYVIDGFPLATAVTNGAGNYATGNPLDNINPSDIESIQVLKDASAAAIYGSRASNGVILISTKKGQAGKPKITYNTYLGINQASRQVSMLDGQGWIDRATEIINGQYVTAFGAKGAKATDDAATRTGIVGSFNVAYFLDPRWTQPGHPGLDFINWQD
ncbi:MAG: TonB-dependent receptor plug domain-containing protein, partial [Bacteroidota bacterium]|nr:TonB-dependent receptor plug domain-containing protein [Bacteroidota bacterium]